MSQSEIRVVNSRKSIAWNCSSCEGMGDDIAALKTVLISLQKEVNELRASVLSLPSRAAYDSIPEECFEELLHEFEQRQERKYNIIVHGLPESEGTSEEDRATRDCDVVDTMLKSSISDFPTLERARVGRLGRYVSNGDKPRPLKVVLNSVRDVRRVLKQSKVFKSNYNVFVSSDRTPRQRDHFNKVKTEFNQRKAAGEDVELKFIRGFPTIKSLN